MLIQDHSMQNQYVQNQYVQNYPMQNQSVQCVESFKGNRYLLLTSVLRDRLFYVSHPSISKKVECSINLHPILVHVHVHVLDRFNELVDEVLSLGDFNLNNVEKNFKNFTLSFKDNDAMKIMSIIFKGHEYHVLYSIYLKWLKESR